MGGSSKSSSSTASNQTTTQLSSDGVNTADYIVQSTGPVAITNQLPEEVQQIFGALIDLAGDSLNLAGQAGQVAIDKVTEKVQTTSNPEITSIQKLVPVFMVGIVALAAVFIWRK